MKVIKLFMMAILLFACVSEDYDLESELDQTIIRINETKAYKNHNHKKDFYSYYLPKDVGIKRSNQISTVILVDNSEVFMALSVSEIMNKKLEEIRVDDEAFVLVKKFETVNNQDQKINNTIIIEQLGENQFLLYLKAEEMFFVSSAPKASLKNILEKMLVVSRTVAIDKKEVISQFSNKEQINYEKEVIELFSESVPEKGFIRDIYESEKEDD